ncbi:MaoC/PaaZ C-terminal domain-containing protein [Sphingomonas sp. BIUV-7]|uniref:MaoC/PaaZ C-terminal domain-containing protein n=1 Tax=Sphingomonas natans TaxID=3063330 RepID=A0ABT8Y844_9SPHN|nr:MaoC/PaaZ C-terminal domain-containing protein [Sphingomonas sp. BIUV-7]MDO6414502.1 MaoC/PaaZ C-terminal domain-containing protein [Sphingomonas sp. BIUV-7]
MHEEGKRGGAQPLSLDMLGSSTGSRAVAWSERDTMLYALGVGAGRDGSEAELGFVTENSGGCGLQAIPSFVTALVVAAERPPAMAALDAGRFLHAGQAFELPEPFPASGRGLLTNAITGLRDTGADAIVTNSATLRHDQDGRVLARLRSSIFVRGGGGFDKSPSEGVPWSLPARDPDREIVVETRPDQALLYRLSGDRHRLHSDPAFARKLGFERPILHGLCTYGIACRALVRAAADGMPSRLRGMDARFRRPVMPGDTLATQVWLDGTTAALFRVVGAQGQVVLDRGTALLAAELRP